MEAKQDSYMKIVLTSSFHAFQRERWLFYFNAEWLQIPGERGTDVIGIAAAPIAIKPNTISGYLLADKTTFVSGMQPNTTTIHTPYDYNGNNVAYSGIGAAFKVKLPEDVFSPFGTADVMYDHMIAFISFEGTMTTPTLERAFNTIGTYAHQYTELNASVSIGFDCCGILNL